MDDNKIIELYKTKSGVEIANIFEVDHSTIYRRLRKNNIKRRNLREAHLLCGSKERKNLDIGRIIELYQKKSCAEIAKIFGVNQSTINRRLKKNNIKRAYKGHPLSEETKKKLLKSLIGRPCSEETRHKLSESNKGKHSFGHCQTEESKKKISNARKGIVFSKEHIRKLSESHIGNVISKETRDKLSISHRGEKGSGWKGGITPLHQSIRGSYKAKEWRLMVFGRDNFTCQDCGKRGCYLEAHHIKKFSSIMQYHEITTKEESFNCEALWDINNGITLCKECHKKLRGDNNGCN